MLLNGNCCFFSHVEKEQLQKEHWNKKDIQILNELGFHVTIATNFREIPWGYDLYFSWWTSGSILPFIKAALFMKPIVVVAGGHDSILNYDSADGLPFGYLATSWYKKLATRICLRYATVVLVVSKYMVNHVRRLGASNPVVVYNCIDTKTFKPGGYTKIFITTIFNSEKNAVKIKRGKVFIQSIPLILKEFPKQKFMVIGKKGNAYKQLQQLVLDLCIAENIEFIGPIDNSQIPKYLQKSRLYVQISESETFGIAIAEAMSCGIPVVVSKQAAIPEIVGNCGIYVDHNDPKSIAAAIINLLRKGGSERKEIGLKARLRIIKNFSYEKRKRLIKQIIKDI